MSEVIPQSTGTNFAIENLTEDKVNLQQKMSKVVSHSNGKDYLSWLQLIGNHSQGLKKVKSSLGH